MRQSRNGFTLVEVIVALGLFALIAVAGFSLLSGVLRTQEGTEGRLRRLSEIQRALFVVNADLDQLSGQIDGGETALVFQKSDLAGHPVVVRYGLQGDRLVRTVSGPAGERAQPILGGVAALTWSYHRRGEGWLSSVSPLPTLEGSIDPAEVDAGGPSVGAVSLTLQLAGVDARPVEIRRIVAVPEVQP